MRIVTATTLYPNAAAPAHGVFVENRVAAFAQKSGAEIKVVAPVPWFPVETGWAGKYGRFAAAPGEEMRRGLAVLHPRYLIPPRVGMTYAAKALERCFFKAFKGLIDGGWDFELVDAHYLYPDGVAAVRAARRLGKPVVITARGTDVNLLPRFPRQRAMILEAVRNADAVVCVAAALKDELVRLGAPAEKIGVMRNGVDLDCFRPLNRDAIRRKMKIEGKAIASVGHLIERKGHHLVIEAVSAISDATLLIAGEGEERKALEALAQKLDSASRVRFLGAVPHERLGEVYSAADALVLASSREGWPNVLLEAMACGTPAVATPVWGSSEVIAGPQAGRLADERTADAIASALKALLAAPPTRAETRAYAEKFSWDETSENLAVLFARVLETRNRTAQVRARAVSITTGKRQPKLIITVDTEEAFDWNEFDSPAHSVAAPEDIGRFQRVAVDAGAKPLYFLTTPVIETPATAAYFGKLAETGAADFGLHLHQWTTPPRSGFQGEYYSWQCNLPPDVHRKKLQALAQAFERALGFCARAHRAGRYGISPSDYAMLADVGVDLDFSPSAGFDFSRRGGPDFSGLSNAPFVMATKAGDVFVTPVCGAWALRGSRRFLPAPGGAAGFSGSPRRFPRVLAAPTRLTCEGARFDDLCALARRLIADGTEILTFSLHSTSMTPGANPYAQRAADVDAMLDTCRQFFDHFVTDLGGAFVSLDEIASLYGAPQRAPILNPALSAAL